MDLSEMFNLSGHTVLVTGSSRGIGLAIAAALAQAGANVAIHGSRESDALGQAVKKIDALARPKGAKAAGFAADLANSDAADALPEKIEAALGAVDILVLNASAQKYQTIEEFTTEEFALEYRVNVQTAFMLIKKVLPGMKQRKWGRILSIGSVNQWKPSPLLPIYASSKSAQANLILNCARQYSSFGITANNLAPGIIETDRNREALQNKGYAEKLLSAIPAGRFGTVEDCAGLALLLCSNAGSYITGADIAVAGGMQL